MAHQLVWGDFTPRDLCDLVMDQSWSKPRKDHSWGESHPRIPANLKRILNMKGWWVRLSSLNFHWTSQRMFALPPRLLSMTVALSDLCIDPFSPEQGSCQTNHLRVLETGMTQLAKRRYLGTMLIICPLLKGRPILTTLASSPHRPWSWPTDLVVAKWI